MNLHAQIHRVLGVVKTRCNRSSIAHPLAVALVVTGSTWICGANLAVGQQREGERSAEAASGDRRSPEAEAGPRRSAEREAGARRSPEAEGQRRSAERDADPRRSPEGARDGDAAGQRDASDPLRGFRPQTTREANLLKMIVQLQREVTALRREVQAIRGMRDRNDTVRRDGDARRDSDVRRDGDGTRDRFVLSPRWRSTKDGKVFNAYDKNGDEVVSLDEWLAMTNGNISPARREIQTKRFNEAEPSGDGRFTPAEFIWWYSIGRHRAVEQSRRTAVRDGEGGSRGPRDGEGERPGPRDGDPE